MSINNELKNKLTNWLLEEGVTVTQVPDEVSEFRLQVSWGYFIDVVKPKNVPRLVSTAKLGYTNEVNQKKIAKLKPKEKIEMSLEVQKELSKFPVGYQINPNGSYEKFESIDVHYTLFLEDLTKTAFFNSFDTVRRALFCFSGIMNSQFDIEAIEEPKTTDNKSGVYG